MIKKAVAGGAFLFEHLALAQTGVHQESKAKRQVGFAREIVDGLRAVVFLKREILSVEITDDFAVFVADRSQDT